MKPGREENQRRHYHHVREHPNRKQHRREHVKHYHRRVGPRPGAPVEQEKRHRQVVKRAEPAEHVGRGRVVEQPAHQRQVVFGRQPDAQRQRVQQPVGVQLGQARVHVHDAHQQAQGIHGPAWYFRMLEAGLAAGIDGKTGVGRQKNQQQRRHTHEVVVVQVGALVHELDVGEAQEKPCRRPPIPPAHRYQQRAKPAGRKQPIGVVPQRPYELKPVVREEKRGPDVQLFNPPLGPEPHHAAQQQQPKRHAKYRQGRGRNRPVEVPRPHLVAVVVDVRHADAHGRRHIDFHQAHGFLHLVVRGHRIGTARLHSREQIGAQRR